MSRHADRSRLAPMGDSDRLRAELRAREVELQACGARLADAIEGERRRIERDLHDGTQGRLVQVAMLLGLIEAKLATDPDAALLLAREAHHAVALALREVREVIRGGYPTILAERGLGPALEELGKRAALPTVLRVSLDADVPFQVQAAAYFVVSEALTNAVKHARARELSIAAWCEQHRLTVEVHDDGRGGATTAEGSGLRGLADRVAALGGLLELSSPPGRGTTVRLEISTRTYGTTPQPVTASLQPPPTEFVQAPIRPIGIGPNACAASPVGLMPSITDN